MFLIELRSLHKVNLSISLDEVIADTMNVVYDHKLDVFLLHSLGEIEEDLVIVLYVLAELHNDVVTDGNLSDNWLVLDQEVLLHLIEPLFVEMLTCDHEQCFAS